MRLFLLYKTHILLLFASVSTHPKPSYWKSRFSARKLTLVEHNELFARLSLSSHLLSSELSTTKPYPDSTSQILRTTREV
jgi:hypothetical protein